MERIGVLVSGRGSNLQALIDAEVRKEFKGEIAVVISNKSSALAITRAKRAGISTEVITKIDFPEREEFDRQIIKVLEKYKVSLVVLAGYMRMFTRHFIDTFESRIINVHPSLLPSFKGVRAQWQAVECGVRVSGCTTHFVTHEMDVGPIILQRAVPVFPDDTGESLSERILPEEHRILVKSIQLYCENKLRIEGERVIIEE
ncbi:phosphoribosylglycinamide formyltransferase [Candidatus Thorarchaeota archaeon]|nr:MAG: phosphoribosylglycinamide formyltransferase [Candidatus Thorarchaeota archaeon]